MIWRVSVKWSGLAVITSVRAPHTILGRTPSAPLNCYLHVSNFKERLRSFHGGARMRTWLGIMEPYFVVSTMLGATVSFFVVVIAIWALFRQYREILKRDIESDVSIKDLKIKVALPSSITLLALGMVALYFFTVNRTIEFSKSQGSTAVGTLCDLTNPAETLHIHQFSGDVDPDNLRIIRLVNEVLLHGHPLSQAEAAEMLALLAKKPDLFKSLRNIVVMNSISEDDIRDYCAVRQASSSGNTVDEKKKKTHDLVQKLMDETFKD